MNARLASQHSKQMHHEKKFETGVKIEKTPYFQPNKILGARII